MPKPDETRPAPGKSKREPVSVLLVEDDQGLRELLREELEDDGYRVREAGSAEEANAALPGLAPDLVVCDLRLPGGDAFDLLRETRKLEPAPAFVIITAFGTVSRAVEALKEGADDFLTKPLDLDHFRLSIARVLETRDLRRRVERYRELLDNDHFHGMVGQSEAMRSLVEQVRQVAHADGPVLIIGESGVGKELVARAVHRESRRGNSPLIAVNCAGIPSELLESEFFGHAKGAFTGAVEERDGLFAEAHGGSLFLDEISEMPLELQAKLLRVLEDGKVRPVGGGRERTVDTRILAATNRDIEEAVSQKTFRADLFYRLETFTLRVPPLRERVGDLELLTGVFLNRFALAMEKEVRGLSPAAWRTLRGYPFPGNVRELRNAIERGVAFCRAAELDVAHLPRRIREHAADDDPGLEAHSPLLSGGDDLERLPSLSRLKRLYIDHVLERVEGNKSRASSILGISRRTLYRHLEDEPPGDDPG